MNSRELKSVARGIRSGILGKRSSVDMCMVVSAPLQGMLSAVYGVACELEEVWFDETPQGTTNHVFLRLPDGRILDATADQFGLEPVYLGPMPTQYQAWIEEAQADG
jgi:hypothetical protein